MRPGLVPRSRRFVFVLGQNAHASKCSEKKKKGKCSLDTFALSQGLLKAGAKEQKEFQREPRRHQCTCSEFPAPISHGNSSDQPGSAFPKPTFQGAPLRKPPVDLRKWETRGDTVSALYDGSLPF